LFSLYAEYVGEPDSRMHVYGYWLFLLGCCVSFLGVLVYQLGPTDLSSPQVYLVREVSTTLAGIGLPLGLLGIVLMLPVKRRAVLAAFVGAGVALLGVGLFTYVYPYNWVVTTPDYSDPVIGTYTVGVAVVAGVAALVPVVTGENSLYFGVDWERSDNHPDVMVGEADEGATFAVYRTRDEWTWRLVEQSALAGDTEGYLSRLETEERVEQVQSKVREAGLIEVKHAAFRLYQAEDGRWRWLLMAEDGSVIADSGDEFDARDDAAESVSVLKEHGPDATVLDIEGAAFDFHRESGGWHWRAVDEDRDLMATSARPHDDHDAVEAAADAIRDDAADADLLTVEQFGVELHEADGASESGDGDADDADDEWQWELLDADLGSVGTGSATYGSRGAAESAAYDLLDGVGDAPIVDASAPAYEAYQASASTWRWRLVDENGTTIAESHDDAETAEGVSESARALKSGAETAEVLEMDEAAFEYYRVGDRWRWRLVTETRDVVAESTKSFESRENAAEGVETAKEQALAAELIDFDEAAFQLYETDGEWRWRLIDEDGNVMADSGEEHSSRDDAAASMMTLKENAPDADLLEIETAAFELFHDEHGNWNWRLVNEGGETIAQGVSMRPSQAGAKDAMNRLVEKAEDTGSREMADPVFHVFADEDDEWWWRFVRPNGSVAAESARGFATRDETETAIENRVRAAAGAGPIHEIGEYAVRLRPATGDDWRWTLVDTEGHELAESSEAHSREETEATVREIQQHAAEAVVFELQDPTFLVAERDGVWEWDFVDADRTVLARGADEASTREAAMETVDRVRRNLPTAGTLDYDETAFEVYDDGDRWQWRLIDDEGSVIAAGSEGYDSRADAEAAIDAIKGEVRGASILEIDTAAFELHENDGDWQWRLLGEDGNELAESLRSYPTRGEAREAMNAVKEFGDDAMIQFAE
jgi:uncharacterized protein YegP (UPF0339 family)